MRDSGQTIADYQIVEPLAENSLFESYWVTGGDFAQAKLLLLSAEQLADKGARQAFLNKAQGLLENRFPGLCGLLAAETNFLQSYCLYPLPEGQPLSERLHEPVTPRQALEMVRQLAELLAPAHAAGFWHGTLSPAAIYSAGEQLSIDQFALASLLPLDFHSGVDPCYSCPELVRGEPLGAAADQYSLGILLYRLLTGRVPFQADEPFATAMLHLQEAPTPLPASLALLQPLVDGLLRPEPLERIGAMQLVSEIDQLLQAPELESLGCGVEVVEEPVEQPDAFASADSDEDEEALELTEEVNEEGTESFEQLLSDSDLAARIEQRLQERAGQLQESEALVEDVDRANGEQIAAISREGAQQPEAEQEKETMQYKRQQLGRQQRGGGLGRFIVLIAAGIAVGVIIYYAMFGGFSPVPQADGQLPAALLSGLEAGNQQLQRDDLAAAEETFRQLVDRFALYPQPYNDLAAVYARQGQLEQARDLLERAMATDAAYAVVYRNLGTVYSEMARDSYGRALQLEQGQPVVALQLFGGEPVELAVNSSAEAVAQLAAAENPPEETTGAASETAAQVQQAVSDAVSSVVAKVKPKSEAEQVVEEVLPVEPEAPEEVLQRWAAAWSAQDVAAYLSFYAPEYQPPAGRSRAEWEKQRQVRLTRPASIEVTLSDFVPLEQTAEQVQLEVTQGYKSDRYADRTRKRFDLVRVDNSWQIVRERSLGRVR